MKRLTGITLLVAMISVCRFADATAANHETFFKQHCIKCHGGTKQKGDLRLDTLKWNQADSNNMEVWQAIVDRIDADEMPPDDEPRPAVTESSVILKSLNGKLAAAATNRSKQVVLRRLNRAQYRNTIRDLLHIDVAVEDPTEAFSADDKKEGFDNLGEALQMSDFLLRQYLIVARSVVDQATFTGEMPEAVTYTLNDGKLNKKKARPNNFKTAGNDPARDYVVLYQNDERTPGDPRGQSFINAREGAEHDGWYEFTYEVESKGRGNFSKELSGQGQDAWLSYRQVYRPEDLHRFEIYLTAPNSKSQIQTRPRHLVAAIDLPDNERLTIKRRLWLPQGWRVEAAFGNAFASDGKSLLDIVDPDFDLEAYELLDKKAQRSSIGKILIDALERYDAPRIDVYNVTETGPHYEQWPPASHQAVYGRTGQSDEETIRDFATRAFRRSVTDEQIAPYLRLAKQSPEGIRSAIEAILCSSRFVYLFEESGEMDDNAIAARLSYFLWNTLPDDALLKDAERKRLRDPEVLHGHVDRMLSDPRSDEFIRSFVWAWLKLQNTVEMAPDPMKFHEFHRNRIADAMTTETISFFRHLLTENLPIEYFIDSDFAIINADLGRHYGIPGKVNTSAQFQKVALNKSFHRGGLLGQAAVLTASANGVDTSPVVRGIWILENLLGTPPDPPPPGVEVPEPDTRGELTIRQLYAKHRTVESCNDCHKKIDPVGFALENFDAVGNWRTKYESGNSVDPSGQMPDGKKFRDVNEVKQIMVRDMNVFSRNLTSKLMTYGTGRTMDVADRPEIDRVVDALHEKENGLRDLIKLVVTSRIFLTK
ncbi:MAG: hypothetical protein COA78_16075 [Blastopirellula sp.]|nr:MAG: hypothetical protein COA78_16075 [Blastopirellula sp.]